MSTLVRFFRGALVLPRGARLTFGDRTLRRLVFAPVLLAALVVSAVIVLGVIYVERHSDWRSVLAAIVLGLVLCVGAVFFALTPFAGALSDRTEVVDGGRELPSLPWARVVREALRGLGHAVLGFALFVLVTIGLLVATSVTPYLAPIWAVVSFVQTALFVSWSAFDAALSRRELGFADKWRWVATTHRASTLGFGAVAALLLAVPGLGLFMAPVTIVSATLLVRELETAG